MLTHLVCAPQLSQLRHVTLTVGLMPNSSLSVAQLVDGLHRRVESLSLTYIHCLPIEQAMVVVPASLRALCVKAVGRPAAQGPTDLTFGLHAGLERLYLVLWESRVGLQCLDAGAATGLRELIVQARAGAWTRTWLRRWRSGTACWSAATL